MKIGKATVPRTAICTSDAHTIVVRGRDLSKELIGKIGFVEHFFLLLTGQLPSAGQAAVLNATLVAIAEHGLVPSVQASRMTYAAAPEALQGAVAAGILGCGSVILGAAENAGRMLADVVARSSTMSLKEAASAVVGEMRAAKRPIPGYGHPLHKGEDPRASKLFAVATAAGVSDRHRAAAKMVESLLPELTGKHLVMNVSAAIPAVLLDAGFPVGALKGVPILARTASLIAHLLEEQIKPIGFVLSHAGSKAVGYDGSVPSGFVAGEA